MHGHPQHTIILQDVPILPLSAKNEARRLITLLDALCTYLALSRTRPLADIAPLVDESKTRLLARAEAPIDSLFFPDAVAAATPPAPDAILDDLPTSFSEGSGSQAPGSSGPVHTLDADTYSLPLNTVFSRGGRNNTRYEAQDTAGEVTDSLVEEMLGDVQQDLEAPYRPNISSYDQSAGVQAYERDQARAVERKEQEEQLVRQLRARREQAARAPVHPSAATPSFQSLAIFTGAR